MTIRRLSELPSQPCPRERRRFLPTSRAEALERGWEELDVVLVTGDAYVDHPAFGAAAIGRLLEAAGYRVGILPQPDWRSADAFAALGRPRLFFGVTAGAMDSLVNHYTAHRRRRSEDAYSPGGRAGLRPDRAATVYSHRCREAFKDVPIVLGGVEASLRRLAHYDYWDDRVRRSVLFDAKADILVYGQGEKALLEVAAALASNASADAFDRIAGIARIIRRGDEERLAAAWGRGVVSLPPYEAVSGDRSEYARFAKLYRLEHNPQNAKLLLQPHGRDRAVAVSPPMAAPSTDELDRLFALPYVRAPHPRYGGETIPAFEQIKASVQLMRGCFGGCAFCCITEHQGREVASRSAGSVLAEVEEIASSSSFRGTLSDLGGPTANLWQMGCGDSRARSLCRRTSCLFPRVCSRLHIDHRPLLALYEQVRAHPRVRHAFIGSGVRYDVAFADPQAGEAYLEVLVARHVSGQLKVAPEHVSDAVLQTMRKPPLELFERFRALFERASARAGKEQYLVPYFVSSHPGCSLREAAELHDYLKAHGWRPQQVQDFMPTPMTLATDMFYSGIDPATSKPVFVERDVTRKRMQKALLRWADPELAADYARAMRELGRGVSASDSRRSSPDPQPSHRRGRGAARGRRR